MLEESDPLESEIVRAHSTNFHFEHESTRRDAVEKIKDAFQFAKGYMTGTRKSGKPELSHSAEVALMLARHGHPTDRIVAGLLHDLPEDHDVRIDAIRDLFGEEVASMVFLNTNPRLLVDEKGNEVLGKGKKRQWIFADDERFYRLSDSLPRYAPKKEEAVRRERNEVKYDKLEREGKVDPWIIKIYDSHNNLEDLDALPPDRQDEYGRVFLERIAPILNRLDPRSLDHIMSLLEDRLGKGKIDRPPSKPSFDVPYRILPPRKNVVIRDLPPYNEKSILIYTSSEPHNEFEIEIPRKYETTMTEVLVENLLRPMLLKHSVSLLGRFMGESAGHIFRIKLGQEVSRERWKEFLRDVSAFHAQYIADTPPKHLSRITNEWRRLVE
ncbi:MAG: HD domain-containing protein [Candidatus Norongarragalinales archaeon]